MKPLVTSGAAGGRAGNRAGNRAAMGGFGVALLENKSGVAIPLMAPRRLIVLWLHLLYMQLVVRRSVLPPHYL